MDMSILSSPSIQTTNMNQHGNTFYKNPEGIPRHPVMMTPLEQNSMFSLEHELRSIDITRDDYHHEMPSFLLLDESEILKVPSEEIFVKRLKMRNPNEKVKVVSIFGNTGEGKSYTLNKTLFDGVEVFPTSAEQSSCTIGVRAAYDAELKIIALDTAGLLGISRNENQRCRLLLNVLAVSDVIIYRTRAERLQRDMYSFLGGASKAYKEHFEVAIQQALKTSELEDPPPKLGPAVIIFHETVHTNTLKQSCTNTPEETLKGNFGELGLDCSAFGPIRYIGEQTKNGNTSFSGLWKALKEQLEDNSIRTKRNPKVIYRTLKNLNAKFNNEIKDTSPHLYLIQYFTCQVRCQSCNERCSLSMSHVEEGTPHETKNRCRFQHQFQNCIYLCRQCHKSNKSTLVKQRTVHEAPSWSNLFNYVWYGYVIDCPHCGEIYRSRKHWYGNKNPEDAAVLAEVVHVWPGENTFLGSQNSAQRLLDGVNMISDAVASVTYQPTQMISDWVNDKIAPSYWTPNHLITECNRCKKTFGPSMTKHHCRECGEGFCEDCSSRTQAVPSRGWLEEVRVCDGCYKEMPPTFSHYTDDTDVRVRKYTEAITSSISAVASVLEIPKNIIKETARPTYWMPDSECLNCHICGNPFGQVIPLHHCRDCGKGVCDDCSITRKPVPYRGWNDPVRVCDKCL